MPSEIFLALFAYLLGSIPTGLILTRLFSGTDPRKEGSRNIGATNIFRTAGKGLGILTLAGDAFKGALPIWVALHWGVSPFWLSVSGLAPVVGHIFSVFLRFRGGKGVATALGVYLVVSPLAVLIAFFLFVVIVWKWRYVSLGSITCALAMPLLVVLNEKASLNLLVMSLVIAGLIVLRHRSNIARLLSGTENKWKVQKTGKEGG